ncbi:ScyD/ScyE family protein [Nocardioides sp. TF02-7]|uniref:ScyD/ScyE family protein n=1 Tax=Nocardioides sp. TF02-7 TaxID=2917724 RepID=UPI001F0607B6|nr:ScyD/ScyE family protein [Nocardioides sp. TF02-7]UMG93214.1 ScyD/ScyE family protein [Nocardioides sp. TF02-7]
MSNLRKISVLAGALLLAAPFTPASAGHHHGDDDTLDPLVEGLDGPRGVDHLGHGLTLVTETDGTFSLVVERRRKHAEPHVVELGSVPGEFAPAIAAGRHGKVYILTGAGAPGTGAATLYVWRWGYDEPRPVFDVAAYQADDLDPDDLEDAPDESNPYGLAALKDGSVLIADAAGNDLIRVWPRGYAVTVARFKPRVVEVPDGLPATDPDGNPLPPAGAEIPSESVPTSVTVGRDGYWYVGELRGFPATPGTSEIWRIKPGSVDATCDPERPWNRKCSLYADGLTSVVDLAAGDRGIYAVSLSKQGWLAWELGAEDSEIGGLFKVTRHRHHAHIRELAEDQLVLPGGVDVGSGHRNRGWDRRYHGHGHGHRHGDRLYVTGPVFGPGALSTVG